MNIKVTTATLFLLLVSTSHAFTTSPVVRRQSAPALLKPAFMVDSNSPASDSEIERLRSEAARLRAEAAALEAKQASEMAAAAEKAFRKFDTNQDGEISLEELKAGLEKALKSEVSDEMVEKLMKDFDTSGDGALQLDEFVGVDKFRNKLDSLVREEKAKAVEKTKAAQQEAEIARLLEEEVSKINDGTPTIPDRLVSVLPYLFPLMDGLQYANFLLVNNQENPLSIVLMLLYTLYRAIPFGGFIAFFVLLSVTGRSEINRLVRFNTQQAIYLDIALFFPGLFTGLFALLGGPVSPQLAELSSDAIFLTLLGAIFYSVTSSLLGVYPDKIPLISEAVSNRVPPAEAILKENKELLDLLSKQGGLSDDFQILINGEPVDMKKDEKKEEEKSKKD